MQSQSKTSISQKLLILKHALHCSPLRCLSTLITFSARASLSVAVRLLLHIRCLQETPLLFQNCNWTLQLVCIVFASYYPMAATVSQTERPDWLKGQNQKSCWLERNGDGFTGDIISLMNTSLSKIYVVMISVTHNVYSLCTQGQSCVCMCMHV